MDERDAQPAAVCHVSTVETARRLADDVGRLGAIMALWLATLKKNMFFQGMDGMAYIVL